MSDGDALLAAIVAEPDDDLHRLAYADWIEENGDTNRAEFIRVQIDLARLPEDDSRRPDLVKREQALLKAHRKSWLTEFTKADLQLAEFRRGFVERATLGDEALFVKHVGKVFDRWPLRELVYRWDFDPRAVEDDTGPDDRRKIDALLGSPHVGRITELVLGESEGLPLLADLLACKAMNGLTRIVGNCQGERGGREIAGYVARATHLTRLRSLTIWSALTGDNGLFELARAGHLQNLEYLNLGDSEQGIHSGITAEGVRLFAQSTTFRRLRHLDLCGNWIEPHGARALADLPNLPALESLFLVGCGIEEAGLLALLRSKTLINLRELVVEVQEMTAQTARAIVKSPAAKRLQRLSLHVWPEDHLPGDGSGLFSALFDDEVVDTLRDGLGDRVEFAVLDWDE
jgi:uncharacterized protein (TIGR02996 family)